MSDEDPCPPEDATIIAAKQHPPQRAAGASTPAADATVWAHSGATELARRPGPAADDPGIDPPPDPIQRETPAREGTLLERHLGPPPPASGGVTRTDRAGMPSLLRRDRRYRRFTLLGLGVSILVCLSGWWVLWQLW